MARVERAEPAAGAAREASSAPVRARQSPAMRRRRLTRALLYVTAVLLSLWVLVPIYLITVTSLVVALITLGMSTLLGAPAGYALARYGFRGKSAYRLAILSTRAFPIVILAIPLAVTFLTWGIFDTLLGVALMHTALALPFTV